MNGFSFLTKNTPWVHALKPEGYMFRWTAARLYIDENGESQEERLDYGLVPPGIYVAVESLLESLAKQELKIA